MFKRMEEPRWTWPVTVQVPVEDGALEEQKFRAYFRLIPPKRRAELDAMLDGTDQLLREAVLQVLDVTDEAGATLPHTPELLEALIGIPWVRLGLLRSYMAALSGQALTGMVAPAEAGN
ncbi:MAG: hypothetical protein WCP77_00940 [Roseococcus sp.]